MGTIQAYKKAPSRKIGEKLCRGQACLDLSTAKPVIPPVYIQAILAF